MVSLLCCDFIDLIGVIERGLSYSLFVGDISPYILSERDLLSDAVLAAAVGCNPKWLYNAAARLKRPIRRTTADAVWWRLVHTMSTGLRAPVLDAAATATVLLKLSPDVGRVRLQVSADDAVSLSVDLPRFHDCAAVALAAARAFALPRPRGRPRRRPREHTRVTTVEGTTVEWTLSPDELRLLDAVVGCGCDPILLHTTRSKPAASGTARRLRLLVDVSQRRALALSVTLNSLRARPRGVEAREAFRIEGAFFRLVPRMALVTENVVFDVAASWPGVGSHGEAAARTTYLSISGRTFRVVMVPVS